MGRVPNDYVEKVYAGWLGKVIGIRAGAYIEGWTYERIRRIYGILDGYPVALNKLFAADDDSNGPMFFLRALTDYTHTSNITPEHIGLAWLNYAPYEHGFYWWGGYGKSTEHTSYINLRNGIMAPQSGSVLQNGPEVAEQIGGQIFIDTWGLIAPGNPGLAAEYAGKAASVGHGGNGIYGGQFIASCIAAAFDTKDIREIINIGLAQIPPDCEYARMARDVIPFWENHPSDWEACFRFVFENYGYDKYPGNCHIIPNAALILLALLYGQGCFDQSINICNMCGWDTDCNAANVGTILGVLNGLEGIDQRKWRQPINDFIAFSSVMGDMNLSDLPANALYIAGLGYKIASETPSDKWRGIMEGTGPKCHFLLPGSTHAFLCSHKQSELTNVRIGGKSALKVTATGFSGHTPLRVYRQTYARPGDFYDSRYDPSFSPTVYPGYTITCEVLLPSDTELELQACLYALDGNSSKAVNGAKTLLKKGEWVRLELSIPPMDNACISEIGVKLDMLEWINFGNVPALILISNFDYRGQADYTLDFAHERMEVWAGLHREVSQFSYVKGIWKLEGGELSGSCADFGEAYTGSHDWTDYSVAADVMPVAGAVHMLHFRVQGAIRCYAAALVDGSLALMKNDNGYRVLSQKPMAWLPGNTYRLCAAVRGSHITIRCGDVAITYEDSSPYLYGAIGMGVRVGSHCHFNHVTVRPLPAAEDRP